MDLRRGVAKLIACCKSKGLQPLVMFTSPFLFCVSPVMNKLHTVLGGTCESGNLLRQSGSAN